ncbi:hypothetical protein CN311_02655 [Mesorhizobium sanjuanii]|uniref:Uncharacterized protein n=1 Tax=Mesorhizobium sanjuanii TaxID=2037900 RepID=A0A2A6FLL3_9HYPH|nr:hypothetical protein CN311_02655 [Mesorhizobium sanjuanii]
MAIRSIDRFLLVVGFSTTRVGAFDAASKGCSIPSTLMIFAVRVVLFGQHHGEQAAVVIVDPGQIDRGAYCQGKRGGCGFDERWLVAEPAIMWRIGPCTSITSWPHYRHH